MHVYIRTANKCQVGNTMADVFQRNNFENYKILIKRPHLENATD